MLARSTMRAALRGSASFRPAVTTTHAFSRSMAVSVGDKFPAVSVDFGFPPEPVDMAERLAGKKTIIVGLPGAFTPV